MVSYLLGYLDIHTQKNKPDHFLISYIKLNSKWIKVFNMKGLYVIQYEESVCKKPVVEEDTGINLHDLGLGYEI